MSPAPFIQCQKCSKPAAENDARCGQCGGALARVCGDCQFKNSLAKRFCDRCGSRLRPDTTIAPRKPPITRGGRPAEGKEPQSPQQPGSSLGPGYDPFRGPAQSRPGGAKPQPLYRPSGSSEVSPSRNPTTFSSRQKPGRISSLVSNVSDKIDHARSNTRWLSLSLTLLAGAAGVYGSIMMGLQIYRVLTPDEPVLGAARAYLDAVKHKDYSAAYEMLSEASKAQSTPAEFAKLQDLPDWQYSELNLLSREGGTAILQYSFKGVWQKAQDQILVFVKEDGRWAADRDNDLLARIEDAFDHRDSGGAYRLSILASQTHKWDPLAHAYLCEAAYARRQRSEAEMQCRQALEIAASLPYRLSAATKKHLSLILADVANDDQRYSEASAQYSSLLSSSGLLADEQCHLLLAQADDSVAGSRFSDAQRALQTATPECRTQDESSYISRLNGILDGSAGDDAVALVKKHAINAGGESAQDWSQDHPSTHWSADYLGGTRYKVSLNTAEGLVLTAQVDVWTRNVESTIPETLQ